MKPIDGQHRLNPEDHTAWCRQIFASLREGGRWGIPRSGIIFERRGAKLVLIERSEGFDPAGQQGDYLNTKKYFSRAGIPVTDETMQ